MQPQLTGELQACEARMKAALTKARARFTHPSDKGTSAEEAFRDFLGEYLPRRFAIGHGEVIDTKGHRSRQTDVIIASEDHPFTFSEKEPGLFFVEGVVGAGEVKSVLTSGDLYQSIENSRQFKKLEIAHQAEETAVAMPSDLDRFYRSPPWFLFAYESQLSLPTIMDRLVKESAANGRTAINLVDAVFVLGRGQVVNFGNGRGDFSMEDGRGAFATGWNMNLGSEFVLCWLLLWLSTVMPRVLRYKSILTEYLWAALHASSEHRK